MTPLDTIANEVATTQDNLLAHRDSLPALRTQVLRSFDRREAKRTQYLRRALVVAAVFGSAALLVTALVAARHRARPLEVVAVHDELVPMSVNHHDTPSTATSQTPHPSETSDLREAPVDPARESPPRPVRAPTTRSVPIPKYDSPSPRPIDHTPTPATNAVTPTARLDDESWAQLAHKGRFNEAYALAQRSGFSNLCDTLPARDLVTLSETARWAGHVRESRQPLLSTRARFAGTAEAAAATFALGRIAFDDSNDAREAIEWFTTLLREYPSGGLSREASGRLVEAYVRVGDLPSAKTHAERYLASYPTGPHAGLAHRVLER